MSRSWKLGTAILVSSVLETKTRQHPLNAIGDFIWGILGTRAKGMGVGKSSIFYIVADK